MALGILSPLKWLKTLVVLAMLGGTCWLLAGTNPGNDDFGAYMRKQFVEAADRQDEGTFGGLGQRVAALAVELESSANVRRHNWYLFSIYDYQGVASMGRQHRYLGMAGRFWLLSGK